MSRMKLLPYRPRPQEGAGLTWRPISAWWWMLAAAAAAAAVIVALVVTVWLLAIASGAKAGTDRANSRLDAVRTGLAAGAGAGAAAGLMLAFRRQHHQEIATDLTDRDATERRITELYTKAVEQLGNDKAPGPSLTRVAQDDSGWPRHAQNVRSWTKARYHRGNHEGAGRRSASACCPLITFPACQTRTCPASIVTCPRRWPSR